MIIMLLTLHVCFQDTVMRAPKEKDGIISKKIPELSRQDSPLLNTAKHKENRTCGRPLPAKNSDPFQKEQDHLVEEVRKRQLIKILNYFVSQWCWCKK